MLGSRRAGQEVAHRTLTVLASKDFALGHIGSTLSVRSVTFACGSVAVGCAKKKNVTGLPSHSHKIQQARTAVLTLTHFTIIYGLFVPFPTKWISALVCWRAYKQENLLRKFKFRTYEKYSDIMLIVRQQSPYLLYVFDPIYSTLFPYLV